MRAFPYMVPRLAFPVVAALAIASPAFAQPADPTLPAEPVQPPPDDPDRIPGLDGTSVGIRQSSIMAPIDVVEGDGIKIGEGTSLYPIVGLDTGLVSNVFYEDTDTTSAGVLRLIVGVGTGSLSPQRLAPRPGGMQNPGAVRHRADVRLAYDFYLSGNDNLNEQNGLGIAATFRGVFGPQRTWQFLYLDNFERIIRSANFESTSQVNRDINRLMLGVKFAPQGRTLSGLLHYTNILDLFEDSDQRFANRMQNQVGLTGAWRFRPYTTFFADVSQGFYFGIGEASALANAKADSYPLVVSTGVQTLLTLKTTLIGRVGYTNGFYSTGPSYSTVLGGVQLGYRYSPLGRATVLYEYQHEDSINANYFRDHTLQLTLEQQLVPFVVRVAPELRFRHYDGITTLIPGIPDTRDDVIVGVTGSMTYQFRNSLAAVLQYRFAAVQTDYMYTIDRTDDPSYARHELIAGVRAAL